ncbi:MAG: DUF308 domain-containing protein [Euryarchaeota archaeon]|nr:DUF308 domain-containing protein [Euryarchaeota archaeon]
MKRKYTARGIGHLVSGIVGLIAGLAMLIMFAYVWFIGLLLIFAGLVYLGLALRNREYVTEEHEKPLIGATPNEDDSGFNKPPKQEEN